jgi:uncharacterized membrane protein
MNNPSSSSSLFWSLVAASIGGLIVFAGIGMEKLKEMKAFPDINSRRRRESWAEAGWWVLMAGLAIEIVVGSWSAIDVWQIKQMAIKSDPTNRPITSISATATLTIRGTNAMNLKKVNWGGAEPLTGSFAQLALGNRRSNEIILVLLCDDFQKIWGIGRDSGQYFLTFHQCAIKPMYNLPPGSVAAQINDLDGFSMILWDFSIDNIGQAQVLEGSVSITANASVTKTLSIPPQDIRFGPIVSEPILNRK